MGDLQAAGAQPFHHGDDGAKIVGVLAVNRGVDRQGRALQPRPCERGGGGDQIRFQTRFGSSFDDLLQIRPQQGFAAGSSVAGFSAVRQLR